MNALKREGVEMRPRQGGRPPSHHRGPLIAKLSESRQSGLYHRDTRNPTFVLVELGAPDKSNVNTLDLFIQNYQITKFQIISNHQPETQRSEKP